MGCGSSKEGREPSFPDFFKHDKTNSTSTSSNNTGTHNRDSASHVRQKVLDAFNSQVERELISEHKRPILKALFLGTGESGKSTVFKQMRICYDKSFTRFERSQYSKLIWADTLRAMRVLVDICCEELRTDSGDASLQHIVSQWLNGNRLDELMKNSPAVAHDDAAVQLTADDATGKASSNLVKYFASTFTGAANDSGASTDKSSELERGNTFPQQNTVPATAIRNAVCLIQSLSLTRKAFLDAEKDKQAKAFLHNHVPPRNHSREADSKEILIKQLVSIVAAGDNSQSEIFQAIGGNLVFGESADTAMEPRQYLKSTDPPTRLQIACAVHLLWQACPEPIKRMVQANQLGMETNAAFFLERIGNFFPDDYMAADGDIVRARIKTTGLTSTEFAVSSHILVVTDVGGQRIERKKWIHNFDDTSCVLYVVSVSEYDQGLEEDEHTNRLDEALDVFENICNSQWFRAKTFQLFLNKVDILQQKCRYSSFKAHYSDYKASDTDPEAILNHIEKMFRKRFKWGSRNLYVHRTCATDTNAMKFVIKSVSDMVLFENLKWAGML